MNGIVYLTGAGPGDYRLLTLRGQEVLGRAAKAATPSSSAAAVKKAGPFTTPACPLKSSQASHRPSAHRLMLAAP